MRYDVLIVGGGIAGVTSAAYLTKLGYHVILCESQNKLGGLIGTYQKDGFVFDQGIRAFENSGVLKPMLNAFNITLEMLDNPVTIGIVNDFISVSDDNFLSNYEKLLIKLFPLEEENIKQIIIKIHEVMDLFDVLYEIDNPLLLEKTPKTSYVFKTLLPWLFRYNKSIKKAKAFQVGVNKYLSKYTSNQSLIDMISQHFFEKTPAFFALSYFGFYKEYKYPKGGTSQLIKSIEAYLLKNKTKILLNTKVISLNTLTNTALISNNEEIAYKKIIWAADQKALYHSIENHQNPKFLNKKEIVTKSKGSDSVLTISLGLDIESDILLKTIGPHAFYTAYIDGITKLGSWKEAIHIDDWVKDFLTYSTYELSSPSARDKNLAPKNKTNLIISTLFDYELTKYYQSIDKLDHLKEIVYKTTLDLINDTILPKLNESIIYKNISTPLTIELFTSNTEGSITGWSYKNDIMPSISDFSYIKKSIYTDINNLYQAGQWTFSPAGMPTGILTAKLATDRIKKEIKPLIIDKDK